MPELPDINVYVECLNERVVGHTLQRIRVGKPFFVRSVDPAPAIVEGRTVTEVRRIGKRIAIGVDGEYWLLIHLMIAGRLHWHQDRVTLAAKQRLAAFDFSSGTLLVTEAGTKRRASLYLLAGDASLRAHDPGGLEPLECSPDEFFARLDLENHTLKRALTDPKLFSGIGNAYSDEILHAAGLSPVKLSQRLTPEEKRRLFEATQRTLRLWLKRLRDEATNEFPGKVTAFRHGMAVHGRYGKACPACGSPIQRIRYKSNETNYCARCQTEGKILADRSLSRLLKQDWPNSIDEL